MYKKIGIIGGLSPESTVLYYLKITRLYVEMFGECAYPDIIIYSVNLENYHKWRALNRWDLVINDLVMVTEKLKLSGADFCIIATNTIHKVFKEVVEQTQMPFLHILEPVITKIKQSGIDKVGLLGTQFTMSDNFYKDILSENGISCVVPDNPEQEFIQNTIVNQLVKGIIDPISKQKFVEIIRNLTRNGAGGIILGCTEIPLLINQPDCDVPVFDTAIIHAEAALHYAIKT